MTRPDWRHSYVAFRSWSSDSMQIQLRLSNIILQVSVLTLVTSCSETFYIMSTTYSALSCFLLMTIIIPTPPSPASSSWQSLYILRPLLPPPHDNHYTYSALSCLLLVTIKQPLKKDESQYLAPTQNIKPQWSKLLHLFTYFLKTH